MHIIPLGDRKISASEPLTVTIHPTKCYYWVNDDGRLCLAMRAFHGSILGPLREKETLISLVLDEPPAGTAKDYRVNRDTYRARLRAGFRHVRSASMSGIVGVWDYGQRRIRGRFRLTVRQESYSVLTGWSGDVRALVLGEFTARPNRPRGESIRTRTEEGASRQSLRSTTFRRASSAAERNRSADEYGWSARTLLERRSSRIRDVGLRRAALFDAWSVSRFPGLGRRRCGLRRG